MRRSVKKPSCSARSRMAAEKRGIYFGRMLNLLVSTFRPRTERDFPSNNPQPIEITAFLRRIYFGRACQKKTAVQMDSCLFSYPKEFSPEAHTAPAAGYLPNTSHAWRMCSITCTPKGQRCSQLPQEIHAPAGCSSKA